MEKKQEKGDAEEFCSRQAKICNRFIVGVLDKEAENAFISSCANDEIMLYLIMKIIEQYWINKKLKEKKD